MNISGMQLLLFCLAGLIIGFAKTSIGSMALIAIAIMASIFPVKESTGIVLTMILFADLVAVSSFRKNVDWKAILKLSPFVFSGSFCGYYILKFINAAVFGKFLGAVILLSILFDSYLKIREFSKIPSKGFTALTGVLVGIGAVSANASGPFMAIYLLQMGYNKDEFIGTRCWFFFFFNLFRVPFSVHLGLLTVETVFAVFKLFPVIILGGLAGLFFINKIEQKWFGVLIRVSTFLTGIFLVL